MCSVGKGTYTQKKGLALLLALHNRGPLLFKQKSAMIRTLNKENLLGDTEFMVDCLHMLLDSCDVALGREVLGSVENGSVAKYLNSVRGILASAPANGMKCLPRQGVSGSEQIVDSAQWIICCVG